MVTKVREITATEAQIEWEVHLANRKAAALKLEGDRPPQCRQCRKAI